MLVRDPNQRATAVQLLQHPFLNQACSPEILVPLLNCCQQDTEGGMLK